LLFAELWIRPLAFSRLAHFFTAYLRSGFIFPSLAYYHEFLSAILLVLPLLASTSTHTFGDLLRLLYEQTGRRPSMKIWGEPDLEPVIKRWGGVIDVTLSEEEEETFDRYYEAKKKELEQTLMNTNEWKFDNATYASLTPRSSHQALPRRGPSNPGAYPTQA
jgi:hypothetical protein